jgi:RES domain-containing protein
LKIILKEIAEKEFKFTDWYRAVDYFYTLKPLSYKGSITDIGGRFNIGDIDTNLFPPFPALYMAKDFETASLELFGNKSLDANQEDRYFNALATRGSFSVVKLRGKLDSIVDLTKPEKLGRFVNLIKDFKISGDLRKMEKSLKIVGTDVVRTPKVLVDTLLADDWRKAPRLADVPANPQIFGQLVNGSGIDGILYPSRITGQNCLAIFPLNFNGKNSYVQIDSPVPPGVVNRLDTNTYMNLA